VTLYSHGTTTFNSILQGIKHAKVEVLYEVYTFQLDSTGTQIYNELIAAAKRGVFVVFVYDVFGSSDLQLGQLEALIKAGGRVIPFNPIVRPWDWHRSPFFRNHRKSCVVDGIVGFTGGMNTSDEYSSGSDSHDKTFKDFHTRIIGPSVLAMRDVFKDTLSETNSIALHELPSNAQLIEIVLNYPHYKQFLLSASYARVVANKDWVEQGWVSEFISKGWNEVVSRGKGLLKLIHEVDSIVDDVSGSRFLQDQMTKVEKIRRKMNDVQRISQDANTRIDFDSKDEFFKGSFFRDNNDQQNENSIFRKGLENEYDNERFDNNDKHDRYNLTDDAHLYSLYRDVIKYGHELDIKNAQLEKNNSSKKNKVEINLIDEQITQQKKIEQKIETKNKQLVDPLPISPAEKILQMAISTDNNLNNPLQINLNQNEKDNQLNFEHNLNPSDQNNTDKTSKQKLENPTRKIPSSSQTASLPTQKAISSITVGDLLEVQDYISLENTIEEANKQNNHLQNENKNHEHNLDPNSPPRTTQIDTQNPSILSEIIVPLSELRLVTMNIEPLGQATENNVGNNEKLIIEQDAPKKEKNDESETRPKNRFLRFSRPSSMHFPQYVHTLLAKTNTIKAIQLERIKKQLQLAHNLNTTNELFEKIQNEHPHSTNESQNGSQGDFSASSSSTSPTPLKPIFRQRRNIDKGLRHLHRNAPMLLNFPSRLEHRFHSLQQKIKKISNFLSHPTVGTRKKLIQLRRRYNRAVAIYRDLIELSEQVLPIRSDVPKIPKSTKTLEKNPSSPSQTQTPPNSSQNGSQSPVLSPQFVSTSPTGQITPYNLSLNESIHTGHGFHHLQNFDTNFPTNFQSNFEANFPAENNASQPSSSKYSSPASNTPLRLLQASIHALRSSRGLYAERLGEAMNRMFWAVKKMKTNNSFMYQVLFLRQAIIESKSQLYGYNPTLVGQKIPDSSLPLPFLEDITHLYTDGTGLEGNGEKTDMKKIYKDSPNGFRIVPVEELGKNGQFKKNNDRVYNLANQNNRSLDSILGSSGEITAPETTNHSNHSPSQPPSPNFLTSHSQPITPARLYNYVKDVHKAIQVPFDNNPLFATHFEKIPAQVLSSNVWTNTTKIQNYYVRAIRSATRSIYITNPYVVPPKWLKRELLQAASRGVSIHLLLSGADANDVPHVRLASLDSYQTYVNHGIEIHEFSKRKLHAKVMVVDGLHSCVGSFNLDPYSINVNLETTMVFPHNHYVANTLINNTLKEINEESTLHITKEVVDNWPRYWRIWVNWAYLISRMVYGMIRLRPIQVLVKVKRFFFGKKSKKEKRGLKMPQNEQNGGKHKNNSDQIDSSKENNQRIGLAKWFREYFTPKANQNNDPKKTNSFVDENNNHQEDVQNKIDSSKETRKEKQQRVNDEAADTSASILNFIIRQIERINHILPQKNHQPQNTSQHPTNQNSGANIPKTAPDNSKTILPNQQTSLPLVLTETRFPARKPIRIVRPSMQAHQISSLHQLTNLIKAHNLLQGLKLWQKPMLLPAQKFENLKSFEFFSKKISKNFEPFLVSFLESSYHNNMNLFGPRNINLNKKFLKMHGGISGDIYGKNVNNNHPKNRRSDEKNKSPSKNIENPFEKNLQNYYRLSSKLRNNIHYKRLLSSNMYNKGKTALLMIKKGHNQQQQQQQQQIGVGGNSQNRFFDKINQNLHDRINDQNFNFVQNNTSNLFKFSNKYPFLSSKLVNITHKIRNKQYYLRSNDSTPHNGVSDSTRSGDGKSDQSEELPRQNSSLNNNKISTITHKSLIRRPYHTPVYIDEFGNPISVVEELGEKGKTDAEKTAQNEFSRLYKIKNRHSQPTLSTVPIGNSIKHYVVINTSLNKSEEKKKPIVTQSKKSFSTRTKSSQKNSKEFRNTKHRNNSR
jgi:phosphatidylserine/phosphatidylglycerophosphate/cardiolipin synthase-like enzyme